MKWIKKGLVGERMMDGGGGGGEGGVDESGDGMLDGKVYEGKTEKC